jgi:hypothetical protein
MTRSTLSGDDFETYLDNLSETEKAYLAGIVDGEGSIGIYHRDKDESEFKHSYADITIMNTSVSLMEWITSKVGIHYRVAYAEKGNRKQCYLLSLRGSRAISFICAITPYLIIKKDRSMIAIQFWLTSDSIERKDLFLKLRELNKRGV